MPTSVLVRPPTAAAVIIPAYNEEQTVAGVVAAARQVPQVARVVVVSDGSVDATADVARTAGATVIELAENQGKGAAMRRGLDAVSEDVVVFLDADLVGLTPDHVTALLEPVLTDHAHMTVGVFSGGRASTDLAQAVTPWLSGQRAVRRQVLSGLSDLELSRFGAEVVLTRLAWRNRLQVREVHLADVTQRTKEEKLGLARGFRYRMKMYWEILRYALQTKT